MPMAMINAHANAPRTLLTLEACGPSSATGNVVLAWNSALVQMYTAPIGGTALAQFSRPYNGFNGTNLYVEGIAPGTNVLSWSYSGQADCIDRIRARVLKVDTIEASAPVADNSPQFFEGHKTDFGDPCFAISPGQSLIISYDAVIDENYQVQDFDITLKANVLPASISADQLGESWAKVEGPVSGSLNRTDSFEVKYQNPKDGGCYKFEFDLGILGCAQSGANIDLPLAGAEMLSWLDSEVKQVGAWCANEKETIIDNNYSPIPGLTRLKVFDIWCIISSRYFDYVFDPVDAQANAPCRRFQPTIAPGGHYGYLTINGVVVHGSKINNMMWSLFGRYWGYQEWELRLGAQRNEINERQQLDEATSQFAVGFGADLFNLLQENLSADISIVLTKENLRKLQDTNSLIEEKLWPAVSMADQGHSILHRPLWGIF